jgi:transketolase
VIHKRGIDFELGRAILTRQGTDLTLISTGALLEMALQVAEGLEDYGMQARVLSMPTVKPLDCEAVLMAGRETRAIVTLEEHSILGGLGGAVAEILAESTEEKVLFKRIGLPSVFSAYVGDQQYLRAAYGLSKEGILESIKSFLGVVRK